MTFSFDAALGNDVSLVRWHIGDDNSEGHFIEDETIQYWVDAGTVGSAVVACIRYILSQLSKPDFRLDWMSVSNMKDAREGYEALLKDKMTEFGEYNVTAVSTISQPYRADSGQDSEDSVYDGTAL